MCSNPRKSLVQKKSKLRHVPNMGMRFSIPEFTRQVGEDFSFKITSIIQNCLQSRQAGKRIKNLSWTKSNHFILIVSVSVDAMYAMAHALHNMVVDRCGEFHFGSIAKANRPNHKGIRHGGGGHSRGGSGASGKGEQQTVGPLCEELSPSPAGGDLLQYIRSVSFVSEYAFSSPLYYRYIFLWN